MNKKGFTLVEIIICLVLLTVVGTGTTVAVVTMTNKSESNVLEKNNDDFENALNIYLETHNEVIDNLYNNVEGAVVSLELLKNEGLIDDNLNIDYKKNYFVLSDAVLLSEGKETCNGQVSIKTIKSWDLSKYNTDDIIYICPKKGSTSDGTTINNVVYVAEGNFQTTTSNVLTNGYVAKGENPNNWVKFEVKAENNEWVWFPNDSDKDLWRIININTNGEIKLIYNKYISVNNSKNPNLKDGKCINGKYLTKYERIGKNDWYKSTEELISDWYFGCTNERVTDKIHFAQDIIPEIMNRKVETDLKFVSSYDVSIENHSSLKYHIYAAIKNNNYIKKERYYWKISLDDIELDSFTELEKGTFNMYTLNSNYYEGYIGNLNFVEYKNSIDSFNTTYILNQGISSEKEVYLDGIDYHIKYSDFSYYYPVITLKSNIKIKDFNNCSNGKVRGSKDCLFELIES